MRIPKHLARLAAAVAILAFLLPAATFAAGGDTTIAAKVAEVQKYGNLTLDIKPKALYDAGLALGDLLSIKTSSATLTAPFCTSYSDVDTGSLVVRDDQKNGILVVAINMGNFSVKYGIKAGDDVALSLAEKGSYLAEYLTRQLKRTNARSDYATDSVFANFRAVATPGIVPGTLFRSGSPVNNEIGRASYADALAKAAGIRTVLNLADSDADIAGYLAAPGFKSSYYHSLLDAGAVAALNMGVDLGSADFGAKLARGVRFLIGREGPFLIHCTEGKDRAGFVGAVFEALAGAKLQDIVADYMMSYENYYGVKKGSDQYAAIANSNIVASLATTLCRLPKGSDLSGVDLATAARGYLLGIGLNGDEVSALAAKLSVAPAVVAPNAAGSVTQVEKYGHTVTDISIADFNGKGFAFGDMVTVLFDNGFVLEAPYLDGYYVNAGDPLVRAYPGQTNIAICVNYGKLNVIAQVKEGAKVVIERSRPGAYLPQYEIRKLTRSNKRSDYASDAVFANFRSIQAGKIGKGILYRSSSPIDPQIGRASVADALASQAGIATIVNLSDSADNMKTYLAAKDFASPFYAGLYQNGQILLLNMNLAYGSEEFRANVIKALGFMAERKGPYLIHCTEGKDRAGFVAALIEALMGATENEIIADYMESYANYYGVKAGTEKYSLIAQDVVDMLKVISGGADPAKADLAAGAKGYLLAGGMKPAQIEAIIAKLGL